MPKKEKKRSKGEEWKCLYRVQYEGKESTLHTDCINCKYGKHSLTLKRCLEGMINVYSKEFLVKNIVLGHYIETQYYGLSIELVNQLKYFAKELDNLSLREPVGQYYNVKNVTEGKKKKYPCFQCPINPERMFSDLRYYFSSDMQEFYSVLKTVIKRARSEKGRGGPCKKCVKTTIDDLNYIMDMFLEISEQIIRSGYGVMMKERNK